MLCLFCADWPARRLEPANPGGRKSIAGLPSTGLFDSDAIGSRIERGKVRALCGSFFERRTVRATGILSLFIRLSVSLLRVRQRKAVRTPLPLSVQNQSAGAPLSVSGMHASAKPRPACAVKKPEAGCLYALHHPSRVLCGLRDSNAAIKGLTFIDKKI